MHFNSNVSFETSGLIPTEFVDLKISTSTTKKPKLQRLRVPIQANPLLLKDFRLDKKHPYSVLICKQVYVTRPGTTRIIQAPFSNEAHPKTYCPKSFSLGLVFYLSLFMMMDLSDIITKEDSLAWASLAATALHGWFFSGEKPIVTRVVGGSSAFPKRQNSSIRRWSNFPSILVYNIALAAAPSLADRCPH